MFGVFIIVIALLLLTMPSMQHFIPQLDDCTLATLCNHTGISECGIDTKSKDSKKKLFLDECDMFEYNCDNEKAYTKLSISECHEITTTSESTVSACPPHTTCSCQTVTKTIATTSTITTPTSTALATITPMTTTSTTTMLTTTTPMNTTPTTTTPTTTTPITTTMTITTAFSTKNSECSRNTFPERTQLTPQSTTHASKEVTKIETKETLTETIVEYEEIKDETTTTTTPSPSISCNVAYSNDCELPSTWETTSEGETRDYFQIMKSFFGRRVRFLKATTHFPRRAPMLESHASGSFVLGRHNES